MPIAFDIDDVDTFLDVTAEKQSSPPPVAMAIGETKPAPSILSFPPGCEPREGDPVYLDIETVPDDESTRAKFFPVQPLPAEVAAEKMMDVDKFIGLAIAKQEEYLDPITPPQAWVSRCIAAELTRDDKKTRDGTMKLLHGKRAAEEQYVKSLSVNPMTLKIVSIGIGVGGCPVRVLTLDACESESSMLSEAWKILCDRRFTPIVGFGVRRFDLPAMLIRSSILGVDVPRLLDLRKYGSSDVIDFENVLFDGQVPRGHGMKACAGLLGIDVPESHGDGSQVYKFYKDGNWAAIATYNRGDVEILRAIHEKVSGKLCL